MDTAFNTDDLFICDPNKNTECIKSMCHLNGGPCYHTTEEIYKMANENFEMNNDVVEMEHEIRFYLKQILQSMEAKPEEKAFKPQYIVTAVQLPSGAIEIAVNNTELKEKIEYILETYDENMHHKNNNAVIMQNIMVV